VELTNDLGQKIKGKTQQLKGDLQIRNGNSVEGGLKKAEGKINEFFADTKIKAKTSERRRTAF
jgi:uncharacterized protein YjbJ (UPF0337 family)